MIVDVAIQIDPVRWERASHDGSSMAHSFVCNSDLLNSQGFFLDPPYAALMAPRSPPRQRFVRQQSNQKDN